jgi:hypothetical protein
MQIPKDSPSRCVSENRKITVGNRKSFSGHRNGCGGFGYGEMASSNFVLVTVWRGLCSTADRKDIID